MNDQISPASTPAPAPLDGNPKKSNCFLRGCLIVSLLFLLVLCCLCTLVVLPFVTDFDPLELDLKDRIGEFLDWQTLIEDQLDIPGLLDDEFDSFIDEDDPALAFPTPGPLAPTRPAHEAREINLETYYAEDFSAVFSYPEDWDIEVEDYRVTFYDPDSFTILFVGEELVENGTTAAQVSSDVIEYLQADAESGTFKIIENSPWSVPTGDDAYLNAFEWTNTEGYYQWRFTLEIVSGESNVFFFLIGDDPELAPVYAELIELIAASFSR